MKKEIKDKIEEQINLLQKAVDDSSFESTKHYRNAICNFEEVLYNNPELEDDKDFKAIKAVFDRKKALANEVLDKRNSSFSFLLSSSISVVSMILSCAKIVEMYLNYNILTATFVFVASVALSAVFINSASK